MKKLLFLALLISLPLLGMHANEKGREISADVKEDKGSLSFSLDGVAWKNDGEHPDMGLNADAITDNRTMVRIEAFAADGSYFALTVYNSAGIGVGSYSIESPGMSAIYGEKYRDGLKYLTSGMKSNPGTISIESLTDEKVKGSFEFKLRSSVDPEDIKVVSGGEFDVEFTRY